MPGNSSHTGTAVSGVTSQKGASQRATAQPAACTGNNGATSSSSSSSQHKTSTEKKIESVEEEIEQLPAKSPSRACAGAAARRAAESVLGGARDVMSDDLRRVIDEEAVTYSWRRKSDVDKKGTSSEAVPTKGHRADTVEAAFEQTSVEQQGLGSDSVQTKDARSAVQDPGLLHGSIAEEDPPEPQPASRGGSHDRPPSTGKGETGSRPQPKGKSVQTTKALFGKPPRPLATSSALVPAKPGAPGGSARGGASASSRPSSRPNTAGRVDINQAAHARAERMASCSGSVDFGVKLISYDGSAPFLKGSFLSSACHIPLCQWACGEISGELACLHVDDWTQAEVLWQEEPAGVLVQQLGVIAGMLADPSLQRSFTAELHGEVFSSLPRVVAKSAADLVIKAAHPEDGCILVSAVENELSMLEACAGGQGSAAKLRAAVQRDLLRLFWAGGSTAADDARADDVWLLKELARSPQSAADAARSSCTETLQRENQLLDAYLLRLLRLKRALSMLLDKWEKVDYYSVLGMAPTCSDKELRNAYRKACLRLHPDKGGDKAQFQQLQDAYARILEERAKQGPPAQPSAPPPAPSRGDHPSASHGPAPRKADGGTHLAIEGAVSSSTAEQKGTIPAAATDVIAALQLMLQQVEVTDRCMKQADQADAKVQQLRQAKSGNGGDAVEALRGAQEAGETLLSLSEEIGNMGPSLSEATMEVSECSLVLAARFAAVPAALLLTDVALSCTFEASRMQHAAHQLLEVRRDTITTLQTLKTNLQMAKIIGTVDAETLKLSLGLVGKAAKRLIASLRQVASAVADAAQRGRQCAAHAKSIAAFAEGRSAAEEACADEDPASQAALPAPDGFEPSQASAGESPHPGEKEPHSSPKAAKPPTPQAGQSEGGVGAAATKSQRGNVVLESRLQNDRLLRQLNADLLDLQRRARTHLAKKTGDAFIADIPPEARSQALQLVAEVLLIAADSAKADFSSGAERTSAAELEKCLDRHFHFVEGCSCGLAMTLDLRTQLLRLGALLDSQAVISAIEKGVKPRLAACFTALNDDERTSLLSVLDRRFDLLCSAVVSSRM